LADLSIDERTMKMDFGDTGYENVDWLMVEGRDRWRAHVITVMNIPLP
jgi:hypothetical protein